MQFNKEKMREALSLIKASDKIIITRHKHPDGDAIGSSMGLSLILKESFKDKQIYLMNEDFSDTFSFLGPEDPQKDRDFYKDALLIITDTANLDRVSNRFKTSAAKLLKIDHHFEVENFGDVSWVQSGCSSTCEMVARFQQEFFNELRMTKQAAVCLYTGIVTDNGDFRYRGTDGDTFRVAGYLVDQGIDIPLIQSKICLEEPKVYKYHQYVLKHMKMTENGVSYVYISRRIQKHFNLNHEQASSSVNFIGGIKGVFIWVAFIENADSSIRARVRSREIDIIPLSSRYGGGGHANACGATCRSKKDMKNFVSEADRIVKKHKLASK